MNTLKRNQFNLKNENGYTLILTLIGLMLITVISMSLIVLSNNSVNVSKIERNDQAVFYIAEAGVNLARAELNTHIPDAIDAAEYAFAAADDDLPVEQYNLIYTEAFHGYLNGIINTKFPAEYENFTSVNYYEGIKPNTKVRIEKDFDINKNDYKIISQATINNQTRTLENTIYFELPNIGGSGSGSGSGSGGDNNNTDKSETSTSNSTNNGSTENIYTNNTNLVTVKNPTLNGKAWRSAVTKTIDNYIKTKDPVISQLYSEYEYHKKVCAKQITPEKNASYELHDPIKAPFQMDLKSKPDNYTVYINGNVSLEKQKFSINMEEGKNINIVICGELNASNGNGSSLIASPSDSVNIFVTGAKSNFNNIEIKSNFVFAPEADIVFGGNVDLCTKLFSNSFTGNGGGGGGFTNKCSKPDLIGKPDTNDSPKPPIKDSQEDGSNSDEIAIIVSRTLKEID